MTTMGRPHGVAFDLDGTLIDSRLDIVAACNHVLVGAGRTPLAPEVIATFIGKGVRAAAGCRQRGGRPDWGVAHRIERGPKCGPKNGRRHKSKASKSGPEERSRRNRSVHLTAWPPDM